MIIIRNDDVVEDINADDLPGFHQSSRQADILLGCGDITGRMIMGEDSQDTIILTHFHSRFSLIIPSRRNKVEWSPPGIPFKFVAILHYMKLFVKSTVS